MTRQTTQPAAVARPTRTPLGKRNRLSIKNRKEGFHYRIVNDTDDRIQQLQEQGYEIVPQEEVGQVGDKRVDNPSAPGSSSYLSVGQGTKAVVMRIREDWYKEDQAAKQAQIEEVERTMNNPKAMGGDYVPKHG
jgi:hypothetical protein